MSIDATGLTGSKPNDSPIKGGLLLGYQTAAEKSELRTPRLIFPAFPPRSMRGRKAFGQMRILELRIFARIQQTGEMPVFPLRSARCRITPRSRQLSHCSKRVRVPLATLSFFTGKIELI